jgi:hypothetical protein
MRPLSFCRLSIAFRLAGLAEYAMSFTIQGCLLALSGLAVALPAQAAEAPLLPAALLAIDGCWTGEGHVMGKSVTMAIQARPVALDALMVVDAESHAIDDPVDRYAAHLTLGVSASGGEKAQSLLTGYWADSFGGGYAAAGRGLVRDGGFDIDYAYPDATFVNRWRPQGQTLRWEIVARSPDGTEKPFAYYLVRKTVCAETAKGE